MTSTEIADRLTHLPTWQLEMDTISRTLTFAGFLEAMTFVNRVADAAEEAGHHPNIDIRWNKVRLALTSHDAGGLTELDFHLAAGIDSLV